MAGFLDRVGLDYVVQLGADHAFQLRWNADILTDFSRDRLVDFLWAHGARFEDS